MAESSELEGPFPTAGPVIDLPQEQGAEANDRNPTTQHQNSLYSSLVSIDHESGSQRKRPIYIPELVLTLDQGTSDRRLRDRFKAAFRLKDGPQEKTRSIFDNTFDQKIRSSGFAALY